MKQLNNIAILLITVILCSCGEGFLDVKRDANQVVPATIADYAAILARDAMYHTSDDLAFLGADEYFVADYASLVSGSLYTPFHKNAYVWADDVYEHQEIRDWNEAYEKILYANLALDVQRIEPSPGETNQWNLVKGSALFHRAWNFYKLAQLFCPTYDPTTASTDLGVPLRLDYDVSTSYGRPSLAAVYDRILTDLHDASGLEWDNGGNIFLPSKAAVHALLARVYLQMADYDRALEFADRVLEERGDLIDYNQLDTAVSSQYESVFQPHAAGNPAVIFISKKAVGGIIGPNRFDADTTLLKAFDANDLRLKVYFFNAPDGKRIFVGSYMGQGLANFFTGFSAEEAMLIKAECLARQGAVQQAMDVVYNLRLHRYKAGTLQPLTAGTPAEALQVVLMERRKELYMRGVRWEDLRRLNREPELATTLVRHIEGDRYELPPMDNKWVWPIPENEVSLNHLVQNAR
ncbi:RagB/SusD family nutrient uptake outer membrane protein [Parapedobacter koreensis]|uniref:SusD family protein n=1 Tax=Parapedobacter koreensis TaxID=332977 RepID=A0A1H7RAU0_9SPHI|nr:RagB/SusD family nutrient uptake outer membrane protein [Parapedobacter koreensis]SEL57420.1 SusD family protein [Parapedobacter koreensis]